MDMRMDLLKRVFATDVALVETVAHAQSALRLQHDVHAIIDLGDQDIIQSIKTVWWPLLR